MKLTNHYCDHCHAKAPPAPDSSLTLGLHPEWLELQAMQQGLLAHDIALCPECSTSPEIVLQVIRRRLDKMRQERASWDRIKSGDVMSEA